MFEGRDDIYNMSEEETEEESSSKKPDESSGTQIDPNEPLNDLDGLKDQFQNASESNEVLQEKFKAL